MADTIDPDLAMAFAKMFRSFTLNRLYAAKAKKDGSLLLSRLLYSIARSEEIHAHRALMYLRDKIEDPYKYLESLLHTKDENASINYPRICKRYDKAGKKKAAEAFDQFGSVEKTHLKLLKKVLQEDVDDSINYYVCQICGHIAVDRIPQKCPVCNAVQEKFRMEC
ncbi:MAG: hypothetical protein P8012_07775 [Desulfobacterales bacterium]